MRSYKTAGWAASMLVMAIVSGQADAENCKNDSIRSVSDNGSTLEMVSGKVYEVSDVNNGDTQFWLADDDVLVCDDGEIINNDENGEKVAVKRIK